MDFSWIAQEASLTAAALTVRAQAIDPFDRDQLKWDAFFTRRPVNSTKLREITTIDFRPAADRRAWNQRGRLIPLRAPSMRDIEMVPIEAQFKIEEEEMQRIAEGTLSASQETLRRIVGPTIPARTDGLVMADYRRLELDAFQAWSKGTITAKDPQDGKVATVSFGFPAGRYQTAGTAWNDPGQNAYQNLLAWVRDARSSIGMPIIGVIIKLPTLYAIQADAPNPFTNITGVQVTLSQLQQRISDDLGSAFQFFVMEHHIEQFTDGGIAVANVEVWPDQIIAAVPAGGIVGDIAFAPVLRAMELASQVPEANIDIRGVTVFHQTGNGGRELTVEAQLNAMPIPDEQRMFVINVGV